MRGSLPWQPYGPSVEHLVAPPVRRLAATVPGVEVAPINPAVADTAEFCRTYEVPLANSANCVVIAGRRGEETRYAAAMVLASMQADVNGVIRKYLGTRKASFAPMDDAVALTAMECGGITPIGLPDMWPILVDDHVLAAGDVVIGAGIRGAKVLVPAASLLELPGAEQLALARG
ncbi:YbaK/EbsC family protein [Propionibacteriaceae bacterium Y2011]